MIIAHPNSLCSIHRRSIFNMVHGLTIGLGVGILACESNIITHHDGLFTLVLKFDFSCKRWSWDIHVQPWCVQHLICLRWLHLFHCRSLWSDVYHLLNYCQFRSRFRLVTYMLYIKVWRGAKNCFSSSPFPFPSPPPTISFPLQSLPSLHSVSLSLAFP